MIDPITMGAVDPIPLAENLGRLRQTLMELHSSSREPETLAVINCFMAVINTINSAPTVPMFRGGYRSLYVMVSDGLHSTILTPERGRVYAVASNILEGIES